MALRARWRRSSRERGERGLRRAPPTVPSGSPSRPASTFITSWLRALKNTAAALLPGGTQRLLSPLAAAAGPCRGGGRPAPWPRVRGLCSGHSAGHRGRPDFAVSPASSGAFSINVSGRRVEKTGPPGHGSPRAPCRPPPGRAHRGRGRRDARHRCPLHSVPVLPCASRGQARPTGLQGECSRQGETTCLSFKERQAVRKTHILNFPLLGWRPASDGARPLSAAVL